MYELIRIQSDVAYSMHWYSYTCLDQMCLKVHILHESRGRIIPSTLILITISSEALSKEIFFMTMAVVPPPVQILSISYSFWVIFGKDLGRMFVITKLVKRDRVRNGKSTANVLTKYESMTLFSAGIFHTRAFLFYIRPIITDGCTAGFHRTNYTKRLHQEN